MEIELLDRINILEKKVAEIEKRLETTSGTVVSKFKFQNPRIGHPKLLSELLSSDFCFSKDGLTLNEILEIFKENQRPVVPKKIRDLLGTWKKRKKIDSKKRDGNESYFWTKDQKSNKGD